MAAFERTIKRLMAEQGVRSAAELHRLLIADGVEISYDRVRRYLSGGWRRSRERNIELNRDVARVLGLSAQQKARMAWPDLEAKELRGGPGSSSSGLRPFAARNRVCDDGVG